MMFLGPFKQHFRCKQNPKETGPCKAAFKKWTHVEETKLSGDSGIVTSECVEFTYGGCGGNNNRFPSKLACEMACVGKGAGEPPKPPKRYQTSDYTQEKGTDYADDSEGQLGGNSLEKLHELKTSKSMLG